MSENKTTVVLLDMLAILHRGYYAIPDLTTKEGKGTGALYGLASTLLKIQKAFSPSYIIAAYDLPDKTHRSESYEGYKASRKPPEDDLIEQIEESRNLLSALSVQSYEKSGFEADDVIGTLAKKFKTKCRVVIATGDLDLLQLVDENVGVFFLKRGISTTEVYNEKAVMDRFGFPPELLIDYKGLRGDPSDEIPGVAGIGEKGATELIKNFGTIDKIYKALEKGEDGLIDKGVPKRTVKALVGKRKEAEMSKDLATIVCDVPITVPPLNRKWAEEFNPKLAEEYFKKWEFESLLSPLSNIKIEDSAKEGAGGINSSSPLETDTNLEKETAVLLWLVDSNLVNASEQEILAHTESRSLEESNAKLLNTLKNTPDLLRLWEEIERPLVPVIDRMEKEGVKIDTKYFKKLSKEYTHLLEGLTSKIYKEAGSKFNIASPKQLSEVLFDTMNLSLNQKTKTGARSTRESELINIKEEHPIVPFILKYRHYSKLLTTYINVLPSHADANSRIHTTLLQNGTVTGRMSTKNPNLQNIPKKTEEGEKIREGFVARDGYSLLSLDYSQIELRLAAVLSGDEALISVFKRGGDIHREVAIQLLKNKDPDTKTRDRAKAINYGVLYGMGAPALARALGGEGHREEAEKFLNEYKKKFSQLVEYLESVKKECRKTGKVRTLFGRVRIIEGAKSSHPAVSSRAERMAINAPIQGTQSDIIKSAMIKIDKFINSKAKGEVYMLLQIHDELLFEIKKERIKEIVPKLQELMSEPVFETPLSVPIEVDAGIGENWGNLVKYE